MEVAPPVFKRGLALFLLVFALPACGSSSANDRDSQPVSNRRIVSLMPSLTEDLFAIGAGDQIVAVDRFSTDVPGAQAIPAVADVSSVDVERVVALHPDVIVGIPSQSRVLEPLRRAGISVVLFRDDSFADLFANIDGLGVLSGHLDAARRLERSLRARTQQLHRALHYKKTPSVFVVLDTNPIYTAGKPSYIASLVRLAGAKNAADDLNVAYAPYGAEALLRAQPDAIVSDSSTGLSAALGREPWRSLHAVRDGHVFILANGSLLERPGPRYNEGLAWLIARLQTVAK